MLNTITNLLERYVSGPLETLTQQRHLTAIKLGLVATYPLLIVGSFLLLIAYPPLPSNWTITKWLLNHSQDMILLYQMMMGLISLYAVYGIASHLARSYELDQIQGALLAVFGFLLCIIPIPMDNQSLMSFLQRLGGDSLLLGIIVSLLIIEMMQRTRRLQEKVIFGKQVPPAVSSSFLTLLPTVIILCCFIIIRLIFKIDIVSQSQMLIQPLLGMFDSLPGVLGIVFLITFLWAFGIHGVALISTIARPFWLEMLQHNTELVALGQKTGTFLAPEPFYQWFVWIGGSGTTLGLAILLAYKCRSQHAKHIGKTSLVSSCFNINEPLIFGTPIVLNPILMIPFILTPLISATITWFAFANEWIQPVRVLAVWTLPSPIGAFITTGGDYKALLLNIGLIILSIVIYYPFVKIYDKQLQKEEE